ncbi:DUF4386 domain-containing protein [Spongiimicrobium sp. 2-473A-2-J]|uniref:DUF4386 domain-containing protein n=1 Tax=Eudoraea algarum TaxID=3417568 RepID=UPI003D36E58E
MISNKKTARTAGFLYLLLVVSGIFSLLYVPSQLYVWDDPTTTLNNIRTSETLFRVSIATELVSYVFFLLLPLILYKLLHHVHKTQAILMVAFAAVSIPISFLNLQHKFAVLKLVNGTEYLQGIPMEQLQSQLMIHLDLYNDGHLISQVFWALWLFPLGYLIFKSGILPKFLGIFLMLGCIGYLLDFFGRVLLPNYYELAIADYITIPASIGEIGTCLWLLIMGAKESDQ